MKLIVISSPKSIDNEAPIIEDLFKEGLEHFHIRKPKYSTRQLSAFINEIPKKYWNRITIHSHHELAVRHNLKGVHLTRAHRKKVIRSWVKLTLLKMRRRNLQVSTSLHRLSNLYNPNFKNQYDYVLISPVFGSISKRGYEAGFNESQLKEALSKIEYDVVALGGVSIDNAEKVKKMGFKGMAVLGTIWNHDNPIEQYINLEKKISLLDLNVKKINKDLS